MIVPNLYDAAAPATSASHANMSSLTTLFGAHDESGSTGNWSSLIGIVTAIVGNILISFALNIQRYAHTRLERETQERERRRKNKLRRAGYEGQGYGTQQQDIAEERAVVNSGAEVNVSGYKRLSADSDGDGARDTDPLIPSLSRNGEPFSDGHSTSSSTLKELEEMEHNKGSYLRSPYWWTGIILMTTGEAGNFLAYGFAPASIVSPLGVVALVSNCIIAPVMFKEPFRKRDFLGVLIAVGGAVTVVLSANDSNPKLGPDEIWGMITTWEFETYLGLTIFAIIGLMTVSKKYGQKSILIDLGLVGLFGGYTALSTKGVASLLSYTLWRILTFPVSYLLVSVLVFTAVMQIKYVNRSLQRFEATQVIPTQFVLFTLSVILGSAVLYRDFEREDADQAGKFVGGCAMTFLGVWLITSKRTRHSEEEDREPEPEDAINLVDGERYQDSLDESETPTRGTYRPTSPPMNIASRRQSSHPSIPQTPSMIMTPDEESTSNTPISSFPTASSTMTSNPWSNSPPSQDTEASQQQQQQQQHASPTMPYSLNPTTAAASLSAPHLPSPGDLSTIGPAIIRPHTPRGASDLVLNTQLVRGLPQTPSAQIDRLGVERTISRGERAGERDRPRHSIAGPVLSAAPLLMTSPLSSSLSAVVAELRRGGSVRSYGSPLRPGGIRRNTIGDEEEGLDRRRNATDTAVAEIREEADGSKAVRRGRSLSGALNDLFRWMGDGQGDEEAHQQQHQQQRLQPPPPLLQDEQQQGRDSSRG